MTESQILRDNLEYLHLLGIIAWRNNTGATRYNDRGRDRYVRYGHPGSGDILGCLPGGRFLSIECKRPGGRATRAQIEYMRAINDAGGLAFISRGIDDTERELAKAGEIGKREG